MDANNYFFNNKRYKSIFEFFERNQIAPLLELHQYCECLYGLIGTHCSSYCFLLYYEPQYSSQSNDRLLTKQKPCWKSCIVDLMAIKIKINKILSDISYAWNELNVCLLYTKISIVIMLTVQGLNHRGTNGSEYTTSNFHSLLSYKVSLLYQRIDWVWFGFEYFRWYLTLKIKKFNYFEFGDRITYPTLLLPHCSHRTYPTPYFFPLTPSLP